MPSHLDTLAKNYWRKNIKTLDLSGILKESDLTTFALCCAAYSDYVFWSTICRDAKKAIEDLRENPPEDIEAQISAQALTQANLEKAQKQKNSQMKTFLDFAKSLGLTAVDRGKIRGEGKKEADAFSGFLS